ncbi:SAF domain-containing protein [Mycobacterium helveticum]|uniref:Flagellar biosynthesis protein FlgA n=1 Tax=Mycobacterium helveticum TaxID=2592811 RepID=A0A557Y046_9MYCO|nr:SAF domain-containing protein [Mycobacterium helveticum]TVS89911.1 flagellar biosynthesis protein FlgA [Mycobacterium helveticum]TVS91841.1 flagellar biosynthesis protein FlgA [Mycobacterium helveticum]
MTGPSLNPSVWRRLAASRPDWTRTVVARRVAAGGLVVLAGIATLRPDPGDDRAQVVVAAHDLTPGTALAADDLRLETRLHATIPDGSAADLNAVVGATLAGPARRGEVLTDVRLLGSRLAEAAIGSKVGPGARIVPLRLADGALLDVVRVGDVVDVLAAPAADSPATGQPVGKVVATDAVVVLVSAGRKAQATEGDRVVLVALPARVANTVAGSTLGQAVTLTLH